MAVHDLVCKNLGINLQTYLGSKRSNRVDLSYLVSAPNPDEIAKIVEKGKSEGFKAFKVKVGTDPDLDIAKVRMAMEVADGGVVWPWFARFRKWAGCFMRARCVTSRAMPGSNLSAPADGCPYRLWLTASTSRQTSTVRSILAATTSKPHSPWMGRRHWCPILPVTAVTSTKTRSKASSDWSSRRYSSLR